MLLITCDGFIAPQRSSQQLHRRAAAAIVTRRFADAADGEGAGGEGAGEEDPACLACGGILKSDTISFGQSLVPEVIDRMTGAIGRKLQKAHDTCQDRVEDLMNDGIEVIAVHNTFTRRWEAHPYFQMAAEYDYEPLVIDLYDGGKNDYDLARRNVHNVSIHTIRAQRKRWERSIYPY